MTKTLQVRGRGFRVSCSKTAISAVLGAGAILAGVQPALTAGSIDNSAIASGTYGGNPVDSTPSTATVPLADPTFNLTVVKTGVLNDGGDGLQAGETITYTVQVTNNSNVTVTNVTPTEDNIQFGTQAGTGTFGSFTPASAASLAPLATTSFQITYTVTATDVFNAASITDGVQNTVDVSASGPGTTTANGTDTSQNTIPADAGLNVVKTGTLVDGNGNGLADVGETINYTYVVTNNGNVGIDDVAINDTHEGAPIAAGLILEDGTSLADGPLGNSTDPSTGAGNPTDGSWDLLGPGASVTFTYAHTVTQTEFEAQ